MKAQAIGNPNPANPSGLSTLSPRVHEHTLTGRDFKSPAARAMENSQSAFNTSGFGRLSGAGFGSGKPNAMGLAGAAIAMASN